MAQDDRPTEPPPPDISPEPIRRVREQRGWLNEEWRTAVHPWQAPITTNQEAANAYAQVAIKASLTLNGGALIAIPAIIGLFGIPANAAAGQLLWTGALFIGGLVSAWSTAFFAFFALDRAAVAATWRREHVAHHVMRIFANTQEDVTARAEQATAAETKAKAFERLAVRFRRLALGASLISLAAFAGGACIGGSYIVARVPSPQSQQQPTTGPGLQTPTTAPSGKP